MDNLHLYLFRDLPEILHVRREQVLFKRGDPAKGMYVVIEGSVDLVIGDAVIETSAPGAFIGELALIDNSPRSATAVARAGTRVFPIDREKFRSLVQQSPQFALDVMSSMADRLRRANARMSTGKVVKKSARKAPRKAGKKVSKKPTGRARR